MCIELYYIDSSCFKVLASNYNTRDIYSIDKRPFSLLNIGHSVPLYNISQNSLGSVV